MTCNPCWHPRRRSSPYVNLCTRQSQWQGWPISNFVITFWLRSNSRFLGGSCYYNFFCVIVLFVLLGWWRIRDGRRSLSLQRFSSTKREMQCVQAYSAARRSSAEDRGGFNCLRVSASHAVDEPAMGQVCQLWSQLDGQHEQDSKEQTLQRDLGSYLARRYLFFLKVMYRWIFLFRNNFLERLWNLKSQIKNQPNKSKGFMILFSNLHPELGTESESHQSQGRNRK